MVAGRAPPPVSLHSFHHVTPFVPRVMEKPVNPMDGLRVECVGNRHENIQKGWANFFATNCNILFNLLLWYIHTSTQQHYGLGEAGSKRGVFYNMVEDIKSSTTVIVVIGRLVGGYFATTSHTPE